MIIGIDASRANAKRRTGVEWYGYHVIRELAKLDTSNEYRLYTWEPLRDELANLPVNFVEVAVPSRRFWPYTALASELKRNPVDRLFVPSHLVPRNHPKKTVVTVHDIAFRHFRENYSWYHYQSLKYGTKWSVDWASDVIVPSRAVATDVAEVYQPLASKLHVVPNGFDPRIFTGQTPEQVMEVLRRHRVSDPYILFVGRLEARKNVPRLIEAFYRLRDSGLFGGQLVLVGNPGHGYEQIRELIGKQREHDSIIQTGHLPNEEMAALMKGARVFAFPTLYEGFGIPILEAFAAGTPVLTSNRGAAAEVAGDGALLVDPESVDEIHAGIEQLLGHEELVAKFTKQGIERATHFSWQRTAEGIWKVLVA